MNVLQTTAVYVAKSVCIRLPEPPPADVVEVEIDGRRFPARYLQVRVRSGGKEYVYHYLSLGSTAEVMQLLGRKLNVKVLDAPAKLAAKTAEVPALPRQYLTLPCSEKIVKLLELAGGCIDMRTSEVAVSVMCAHSTIKAALKKLIEEGKVVEEEWRLCLQQR